MKYICPGAGLYPKQYLKQETHGFCPHCGSAFRVTKEGRVTWHLARPRFTNKGYPRYDSA